MKRLWLLLGVLGLVMCSKSVVVEYVHVEPHPSEEALVASFGVSGSGDLRVLWWITHDTTFQDTSAIDSLVMTEDFTVDDGDYESVYWIPSDGWYKYYWVQINGEGGVQLGESEKVYVTP